MSAHTPGPWEPRQSAAGYWFIDHERGGEGYTLTKLECNELDARLIAAAPALLDEARCALADLEGAAADIDPSGDRVHPVWRTIKELRAAIKLAGGAP